MYTLYGDANLDGSVNGADLNVVLSNYNQTGMTWSQGDFNYDGTVNGADLNTVLSNYNQSLSVGAAVPEPGSLAVGPRPPCVSSLGQPGGNGGNRRLLTSERERTLVLGLIS